MLNRQIFSKTDPLAGFKKDANRRFQSCAFFNHSINEETNIGSGFYHGDLVTESIITDGSISLQKKNFSSPIVVWMNQVLTLENGTSVSIEIEKATFMINITKYLGEEQVDIHVAEEDKEQLQRILDFFYNKQKGLYCTSSITFTSPTILTLESLANGKRKLDTIDFSEGITKEKVYKTRKNKNRRY